MCFIWKLRHCSYVVDKISLKSLQRLWTHSPTRRHLFLVTMSVTDNDNPYRFTLCKFLRSELETIGIEYMCLQQDGTTCHTADAMVDLLSEKLSDPTTSQRRFANWPSGSCNLTSIDFFPLVQDQIRDLCWQAKNLQTFAAEHSPSCRKHQLIN